MRIQISEIKINPGRRKTSPQYVEELARSITAVGLLNPVTIDQNNVLIAGLHRLEAAKMLGWSEIECTVSSMDSLQAELAEIDENFVRSRLSNSELSEQLLRRKEIYETLHPETRQGKRNGQTSKKEDSSLLAVKPFSQDTAEKMGVSKRTVEQLVQTARDLTPEAKEIIRNADRKITKTDALKISRLPPGQQQEAAARLAAGGAEPPANPRVSKPPANPSSSTHGDEQQSEAIEGLVKEFSGYAHRFISGMKTYKNLSETFAEMSTLQITVIWDAVAAVNKALRDFSKEVKKYQSGDDENEN